MKSFFVALLAVVSCVGYAATPDTLEYKVAVINAGKYVAETDSSIPRAKLILRGLSKCYRVTEQEAADMAAKGVEISKKEGFPLGIIDIMDAALMACDDNSSKAALANAIAQYIAIRPRTGQTHHQAVHGMLILNYAAKTYSGAK